MDLRTCRPNLIGNSMLYDSIVYAQRISFWNVAKAFGIWQPADLKQTIANFNEKRFHINDDSA